MPAPCVISEASEREHLVYVRDEQDAEIVLRYIRQTMGFVDADIVHRWPHMYIKIRG